MTGDALFTTVISTHLLARVFLEMKKHDEALIQLKLLTQFANYRFEVHESLVHAFIGVSRWREAQLQAIEACRILGKSPRIYVVIINNDRFRNI